MGSRLPGEVVGVSCLSESRRYLDSGLSNVL